MGLREAFAGRAKRSDDETPRFPMGYEARIKVEFERGRFEKIEVYFLHESDPYSMIVFVENEATRKHGGKRVELVSWMHDSLRVGRYRLAGIRVVEYGRGGRESMIENPPRLNFVLTDRSGKETSRFSKYRLKTVEWT